MDDQLKEQVLKMAKEGLAFVADQAPIALKEYLRWQTAMHGFWIGVGFVCLIATLIFVRWGNKRKLVEETDGFILIPYGFGILVPLILILNNIYYLIMVTIAPRVYLIKAAMEK